jgi:hypothetical protein
MKDRFKCSKERQRIRRFDSEPLDGQWPRELQQQYRPTVSKAELRAQLAEAMARTPNIRIRCVKSRRGAP